MFFFYYFFDNLFYSSIWSTLSGVPTNQMFSLINKSSNLFTLSLYFHFHILELLSRFLLDYLPVFLLTFVFRFSLTAWEDSFLVCLLVCLWFFFIAVSSYSIGLRYFLLSLKYSFSWVFLHFPAFLIFSLASGFVFF